MAQVVPPSIDDSQVRVPVPTVASASVPDEPLHTVALLLEKVAAVGVVFTFRVSTLLLLAAQVPLVTDAR